MTDITPDHPAVEAAMKSTALDTLLIDLRPRLDRRKRVAHLLARFITAALPHLTADDLPAHLVRDIQVRTIRATARAVTYEEDDTPQGHDWDRATFSAWLNELADNIERDDTA